MAGTNAKQDFLEELEAELGIAEANDRPELAAELAKGLTWIIHEG